ncbi:hypothetical protein HYPSUDRAFT_58280 [Hypholoma sublateritium FD-334 SS-4]|uniref:Protein kinase domain-containing protein n=1 Tax=Hypholoma sublateritium (strain FD-334 SS-4) TaxID=945553 RepID=A0A0D2LZK6_HYPSF|nr:hypothetical protein HYPSUDRAFT_58280 [Hypholoma sublateritium FD-334 SS-4]
MFSNDLEKGFRGMFSKGKAKKSAIAEDSTPIKQKDTTPPLETVTKDAQAEAATDETTHTHIYPKVDEARVRRVLGKQKDAEDFVAEYNRRALQRRAAQNRAPDATESSKADDDTTTDDDATSEHTPKKKKELAVSRRGIMRTWPRAPGGPFIYLTGEGKVAGNNQPLWGATVLDFFRVQRDPAMPHGSTISTGSKLAAWAHVVDELYAKDELLWAAEEEDPIELLPCDISLIIRDMDHRPFGLREMFSDTHKTSDGRTSSTLYPLLQNRIPFHLLPEKLIVHDPDDTLHVDAAGARPESDRRAPRVYKLKLAPETLAANAAAREKALEDAKNAPPEGTKFSCTYHAPEDPSGPPAPHFDPIFATYPPPPPPVLSTKSAHLFLNLSERIGSGHHSHVYRATWEIPRALVVTPYVCPACAEAALLVKLREEAPDVPLDDADSVRDKVTQLLFIITARRGSQGTVHVQEVDTPGVSLEYDLGDGPVTTILNEPPRPTLEAVYAGPIREIPIDVKWSTPGNYCEHEARRNREPTTFKARVAVKLSLPDDEHLDHEAENYQRFPTHFFQHWSGYNVVPPIHDPTPARAIVPQFYGYYVPEDASEDEDDADAPFLSPIILLEDCGVAIEVDELSLDDKYECASLLFRMHAEGWLHESVFPRNVLIQRGDIGDFPVARKEEDRRFRLIDFGRSTYRLSLSEDEQNKFPVQRAGEEWTAQMMYGILNAAGLTS